MLPSPGVASHKSTYQPPETLLLNERETANASKAVRWTLDFLFDSIKIKKKRGKSAATCGITYSTIGPPADMQPFVSSSPTSWRIHSFLPRWVRTTLTWHTNSTMKHTYIYKKQLSYVITVPLVHKRTFSVPEIILISVHANQQNLPCTDVGDSVLCLDWNKRCCFIMKEDESCTAVMFRKRETLPWCMTNSFTSCGLSVQTTPDFTLLPFLVSELYRVIIIIIFPRS